MRQSKETVEGDRKGRDEREWRDKERRTFSAKRCKKKKKLGGGVSQQFEERILIRNADGLNIS